MNQLASTIAAGSVGAALMYAFDPDRGRARRARLRQKLVRAEHEIADEARTGLHDLANRSRGLAHDVAAVALPDRADDDVIAGRVHARIGRAIMHPGGIEIDVRGGVVTLKGPVLRTEIQPLMRAVKRVRGVHHVIDRLEAREDPGNIPALQGERQLGRRTLAPSARLLLGIAGTLVLVRALRRLL